ncbi:hypothetical protein BDZ89DRAFT_1055957 [Hymenopellis radicata]|nr:hypothetical protein BDZ89DRAFT_1055957 [Hymenopellis radicata]
MPATKATATKKAPAKKTAKQAGEKRARSPIASDDSDSSSNSEDEELTEPPVKRKKAEDEELNAKIKVAEEEPESIQLYGKYDLYAKHLPFLQLETGGSPDFEKLLEVMKRLQAKPDYSARVAIPEFHATNAGAFEPRGFKDPIDPVYGEQYEVALEGIKLIEKKDPIIKASMSITNGGCGVASSSGAISMHRCWAKPAADDGLDEIFEASFNLHVSYSNMYRRKHLDDITDIDSEYWGIRARKDASGEEIGLAL